MSNSVGPHEFQRRAGAVDRTGRPHLVAYPWEKLPPAAQRQIKTAMSLCFALGFVAGVVGVVLVGVLR